MSRTTRFVAIGILTASLLPGVAVCAADEDKVAGAVVIGGETTDDLLESSKFQQFRDEPNGLIVGSLTFGLTQADWLFELSAADFLQNDQRVALTLNKPGTLRVRLRYDQTPKWMSNTTSSLYVSPASGSLVLPLPMRIQLQALGTGATTSATLASYLAANQPYELRSQRSTTAGDVRFTPGKWTFAAAVSDERRDGVRPLTLATYFSAGDITEIAAPFDYTTKNAALSFGYADAGFHVGAAVTLSEFTNGLASGGLPADGLVVDNPLRVTDANGGTAPNAAAALFSTATPPDNNSAWIHLTTGIVAGRWGKLSAAFSVGRNKQNEPFLPFSLNSAVPPPADPNGLAVLAGSLATGTPVTGYDGRVDIGLYDLRFSGTPIPWLGYTVFARSYDYHNETPEYTVTDYIRGDTGLEGIARSALPFGWKRDDEGVELTFRPARGVGLSAGYGRETWDREFRNAPQTTENIYKAGVNWSPAAWGTFRLDYLHAERSFDEYNEETFFGEESYPEGEPVNNAIVTAQRLFDLANRNQNRYDLMVQWTPTEKVGVGLSAVSTENDYVDTILGRTRDQSRGGAFDLSFAANSRLTLHGDAGIEVFEYDLDSRYRPVVAGTAIDDPLNDWSSSIQDTTVTYGAGLDIRLVPERWTLKLNGMHSDSTGKSDGSFVPGGSPAGNAGGYPEVTNTLLRIESELKYAPRKDLWVALGYLHEAWDTTDFARDPMQPFMGGVDAAAGESIFLGWRVPSYNVNLVRVLLGYNF